MSLLRSFTSLAVALALGVTVTVPAAMGGDVIPPRPLGRKFPVGTFCPLPVTVPFTAPGASVIVHFDALVYVDDGFGTLRWTEQSIDNIIVATSAQVAANLGPPQNESNQFNCYVDDDGPEEPPISFFYFNNPGLSFAHFELFDTDPTARGWDMSNGAYYINGLSPTSPTTAPRTPETCTFDGGCDENGGALGLGQDTGAAPGVIATTSIAVNGLSADTSYDLTGWWNANFTPFQPPRPTMLTIRITLPDGTPIARKSWGSVKAGYKR